MKKALYILLVAFIAEASFIAGHIKPPTSIQTEASAAVTMRYRASKSDAAIMRKVLPIEYKRLMIDRNFYEDVAQHYAAILESIGYFK